MMLGNCLRKQFFHFSNRCFLFLVAFLLQNCVFQHFMTLLREKYNFTKRRYKSLKKEFQEKKKHYIHVNVPDNMYFVNGKFHFPLFSLRLESSKNERKSFGGKMKKKENCLKSWDKRRENIKKNASFRKNALSCRARGKIDSISSSRVFSSWWHNEKISHMRKKYLVSSTLKWRA